MSAPTWWQRFRFVLAGFLFVAVFGVLAGVMIINRLETGEWQVPDADTFIRIVKNEARPAKTIFLEKRAIDLRPGTDDAPNGVSSVLANARNKATRLPGWKGSATAWTKVVACVRDMFEPFDVVVTDTRPSHQDFVLVVVGGKPGDIGMASKHVGGLAPFSGAVIAKPVVYAFSAALDHDVRAICETIAMEVAHAYGLDHGYECKDVMTYLTGCGAKKFVDKDVRCGEKKPRTCEGGKATQNSYRHLIDVLGARPKAPRDRQER